MLTNPKPTSRTKSGSKQKSKISTKLIAAIIIGIVAIAGVVIVFNSFASGPPAYQYSYNASCEKKTTNINIKTNQIVTTTGTDVVTVPVDPKSDCVKNSAEAMAYRLYYITYAKDPLYENAVSKDGNNGTYAGIVQALAGKRIPPQLIFPNDTYKNPPDLSAFVRTMYKNGLNRTPTDKDVNDWLKRIADGKLNRADVATLFAESPEAKVNLSGRFANYIKNNPKPVTIVPVAQNEQNARTAEAKKKLDEMVSQKDALISEKNSLLKNKNLTTAKQAQDRINLRMIRVAQINSEIKKLADESSVLTKYATNISNTEIDNISKLVDAVVSQSWTGALDGSKYITNLQAAASRAANNATEANALSKCRPRYFYIKQKIGNQVRAITYQTAGLYDVIKVTPVFIKCSSSGREIRQELPSFINYKLVRSWRLGNPITLPTF